MINAIKGFLVINLQLQIIHFFHKYLINVFQIFLWWFQCVQYFWIGSNASFIIRTINVYFVSGLGRKSIFTNIVLKNEQRICCGCLAITRRPRWLNFERDSSKMTSKIAPSKKFSPNITESRHRIAPSLFQNYYYEFPYMWIFWYWFLYLICLWASLLHRHICWAFKY